MLWVQKQTNNKNISKKVQKCTSETYQLTIKCYFGASTDGEDACWEWLHKQIANENISKEVQKCMAKTYQLMTKCYFGASADGEDMVWMWWCDQCDEEWWLCNAGKMVHMRLQRNSAMTLPTGGGSIKMLTNTGDSYLDFVGSLMLSSPGLLWVKVQTNFGSKGRGRKSRGWPRLGITPGAWETVWVQQQRSSIDPLHRFWSDRGTRDQE